jgi:hypothetical protein
MRSDPGSGGGAEAVTDHPGSVPKRCADTRLDGQPCGGPVLGTGTFCFAHDPEKRAAREAARQKGGQRSASIARIHRLVPPRLVTVYDALEEALGQVHRGELAAGRAIAMASLARAMVAVLQAGEVEQRLRELEGRAG